MTGFTFPIISTGYDFTASLLSMVVSVIVAIGTKMNRPLFPRVRDIRTLPSVASRFAAIEHTGRVTCQWTRPIASREQKGSSCFKPSVCNRGSSKKEHRISTFSRSKPRCTLSSKSYAPLAPNSLRRPPNS